ncbi:MAG: hypothetical protein BGO21_07215 [Dyadobacter sp. 50-39]|uniref:hypothetical protein n=1 Tax=Dyadobacter sp. 50-39 TaxID=1895756 RepID=UPI0009606E40|nr:hypothetical protein [Dyadobacter sp. 50-39]OJV17163.1 MAG: hypothetical protein BGO21_07215 [Dyadobacter sp. 50-39]
MEKLPIDALWEKYIHYAHLNSAFDDRIGILDGKSSAILLFSEHKNKYYRNEVSVNFLSDLIEQINFNRLFSLGYGLTGVGILIDYLVERGVLDESSIDIFSDVELNISKFLANTGITDISLASGLSGYGIYFLKRLKREKYNTQSYNLYLNQLDSIYNTLEKCILSKDGDSYDISLWYGRSGCLLFISELAKIPQFSKRCETTCDHLRAGILESLADSRFSWDKMQAFFVMYQTDRLNSLQTELNVFFGEFIVSASTKLSELGIANGALYSLFVAILIETKGTYFAEHFLSSIYDGIMLLLKNRSPKELFPYDNQAKAIPIGIDGGMSAVLLSLWSIDSKRYLWLNFFGFFFEEAKILVTNEG